jgi:hypothetical protein
MPNEQPKMIADVSSEFIVCDVPRAERCAPHSSRHYLGQGGKSSTDF